jgi:hypothetical protein
VQDTVGWKLQRMLEQEAAAGNTEERIVVAVHSDRDRMDEYNPWHDPDRKEGGGGQTEGAQARRQARVIATPLKRVVGAAWVTMPCGTPGSRSNSSPPTPRATRTRPGRRAWTSL